MIKKFERGTFLHINSEHINNVRLNDDFEDGHILILMVQNNPTKFKEDDIFLDYHINVLKHLLDITL
jgi:hypothetical protein